MPILKLLTFPNEFRVKRHKMNKQAMKLSPGLVLVLFIIFHFQAFTTLAAKDPDSQPRMRVAIGHLEAAKTATKPLTSLLAARKAIVNAKPNKEGQRKDAIGYVDEAIAYARTGDKQTMLLKIDKAIANVKSGIARSK